MSFFKLFPTQSYDFNRDGILQNVIDIYRSVRAEGTFIDNGAAYKLEDIRNGERPDIMSQRIYGTTDYYWTFFVINEFLHDGLAVWPMSQEDLQEYYANEFNGYAINTLPSITRNSDLGITDYKDSIANRFTIGETVVGSISGARGTLTKKDLDLNQLVIQDVTLGSGGGFIGDPSNATENIIGETSGDFVATYRSWKYRVAPHHYYSLTQGKFNGVDGEDRPISVAENIPGAEGMGNTGYITNQSYLENLNFKRSKIRIINPKYIEQFVEDFEELINV